MKNIRTRALAVLVAAGVTLGAAATLTPSGAAAATAAPCGFDWGCPVPPSHDDGFDWG